MLYRCSPFFSGDWSCFKKFIYTNQIDFESIKFWIYDLKDGSRWNEQNEIWNPDRTVHVFSTDVRVQ